MIEVDYDLRLTDAFQHARDPHPVSRVELDNIARNILGLRIGVGVERRARQRLHQVRMALPVGLAGGQLELRLRALVEPDQPLLDGWRQLPGADLQGRRTRGQRADDLALLAVRDNREPIMQSDV